MHYMRGLQVYFEFMLYFLGGTQEEAATKQY